MHAATQKKGIRQNFPMPNNSCTEKWMKISLRTENNIQTNLNLI